MSVPAPIFRFGIYRLDPAARELHRDGQLVQLSPKVFDCLAWLFERRERAVGRDELSSAVWGRIDITDAQIDQLIRKVRRSLGDTGSDQEVIRTIPRFGYRWVAEVEPETSPIAAVSGTPPQTAGVQPETTPVALVADLAPETALVVAIAETQAQAHVVATGATVIDAAALPRPPRLRRLIALAGGVFLLLIVAALAFVVHMRGRDGGAMKAAAAPAGTAVAFAEGQHPVESVAVLPVVIDDDVDTEWAWLRLGLMDLIAARLREGGLTVVPVNNVMALTRDSDAGPLSPATVQAATGARIVVAPSIRHTAAGWRLRIELHGAERAGHELEAHAGDAVSSAREAADRLLVLLGRSPGASENASANTGEEVLIHRIDAAIDGGDYETAGLLLDAAPAALRDGARLRLRQAYVERVAGHNDVARDLFQSVLDSEAQAPLSPQTRGDALIGLSVMLASGGELAAAHPPLDEAITLARQNNLPLVYAAAMASRAVISGMQGGEADSDFAQARIALELGGDTLGLAELEANQAGVLMARYRFSEARELMDRAIARMQRFPPGETLVTALSNRIYLHLAMLEPRDALAVAEHAMEAVERVENRSKRQAFQLHMTRALLANGRFSQVSRLLAELGESVDPQQAPKLYASVLSGLAQLAFANARWDDAANLAARQLEILSTPALSISFYSRPHSAAWLLRTRALQRKGAIAEAAVEVGRFSTWAGNQHDVAVAVEARLAQAEQAVAEQRPGAATAAFETALTSANQGAAPVDVVRVAVSYGSYLIDSGDLDGATRIVGQIARWSHQDFDCALLQVQLYHALGQHKPWQEALASARSLAGERMIPEALAVSPLDRPLPTGWLAVPATSPGSSPGK